MAWDDLYEASPGDKDEAKYGAGEIRGIKTNVREREELEHNFEAGTRPFHKRGQTACMYVGTEEEIDDLTGMVDGSIAFDLTNGRFKRYRSDTVVWETLAGTHDVLADLVDSDDHPQYLHLDKEAQTLEVPITLATNVTLDGRDIVVDAANIDTLIPRNSDIISLTFDESAKTITRSSGAFDASGDDFQEYELVYTSSSVNPGPFAITNVSTTVLTVDDLGPDMVSEVLSHGVVFTTHEGLQSLDNVTGYDLGEIVGPEANDCFISARLNYTYLLSPIYVWTGSSSPPTFQVCSRHNVGTHAVVFPVKQGHYWRITSGSDSWPFVIKRQVWKT